MFMAPWVPRLSATYLELDSILSVGRTAAATFGSLEVMVWAPISTTSGGTSRSRHLRVREGEKHMRARFLGLCIALALLAGAMGVSAQSTNSKSSQSIATPKKQVESRDAKAQASLAFVTEYVRELSAIETIRDSSEQSLAQGSPSDKFMNIIYGSTRLQLELRLDVNILKEMRLYPPFEKLVPSTVELYERKIEIYQRLIDISNAFISGPKPGVDYGKLAAEIPQQSALLDYIDNALLEAIPLIFQTLVDSKVDSQNHANHLLITGAERAQLLGEINAGFGSKLDEEKDISDQVSAAMVLKAGLLKDFKSSDDPWE